MRLPTFWRVFSATILAITGVAACLQPNSITCPDGVVCPTGTVCVATRIPLERCVFPAQVDACADLADLAACAALPNGRCYDGVCLPGGCGNGYVDTAQSELVAEQCDDGNTIPNDSCSADCRSNETCGNGVVDLGRGEQCDDRDRLGHDGCSSDCRTESLQLTSAPSTGPMGRSHVAFAYDLARDRVVMFGGRTVFEPTAETWEWDGATWIERHPRIAPPARTDASMVYDTAHHRMILFGGQAIDSFDDTWSWDGIAWTALDPPIHPSKRHDHAMAYDAARHRVVLFGGAALPDSMTGGDDQTWAFDGTTWSPLPVTGPSPRAGHAMAYDPHRDVIVLVGGGPGVGPPETWELDTAGWHDRSNGSNAPNGLDDLTLAFDPQSQRLLTVGLDRSTYGWDGVTWSKVTTTGAPSARRGVAMASDPTRGQIVLFGGLDAISQNPLADTWLLAGTTWTSPLQQRPGGLANFGFARITRRDRALIFGGKSTTGPTDDTWETDGRAWRKLTPATRPSARLALAMAYDEARDEVVMFGGAGTGGIAATNATWLWDGSTWRSTTPAGSPSARSFATMAYDAARHEIVMFGGITLPSDPVAPMWIWDGSTWTSRVTPVDLEGRIFPALAYDPVRERIVLFGGSSEADTWEWDGLSWERRASNGPANRGAAAIAWDPTRRRIVMFGGNIGGTIVDELWEWDGVTWRRAFADPPPPALWGAGMVSGIEGGLLVFGGNTDLGASYASDTMILRWERTTSPPDETCRNGVDVDGDLQIGCDDPDCGWACDPTCLPETTCPANRPRCGDGACSALETCRTCPTDCTCAPVCGDQLCDPGEVCPGDC